MEEGGLHMILKRQDAETIGKAEKWSILPQMKPPAVRKGAAEAADRSAEKKLS